jgi:hypothetical protein
LIEERSISVRYVGFPLLPQQPKKQPEVIRLEPGLAPPFKALPLPVGKQHA